MNFEARLLELERRAFRVGVSNSTPGTSITRVMMDNKLLANYISNPELVERTTPEFTLVWCVGLGDPLYPKLFSYGYTLEQALDVADRSLTELWVNNHPSLKTALTVFRKSGSWLPQCRELETLKKSKLVAELAEIIRTEDPNGEQLEKYIRRLGCGQKRAPHPDGGGETVLCEAHLEEVLRGEAKAPPLRRNLDYVSLARSSFLSAEDKD